jgi:hypothetical protein
MLRQLAQDFGPRVAGGVDGRAIRASRIARGAEQSASRRRY